MCLLTQHYNVCMIIWDQNEILKGYWYDYIPSEIQSKGKQTFNTFINLLIFKNTQKF